MVRSSSSVIKSSGSNTRLFIILGIIAFAIIIGTLIGTSFREKFTDNSGPNKIGLIFLSHPSCGHCVGFQPVWNKMMSNYNDITFFKYDINDKISENSNITYGDKYSDILGQKIDGVPTIILVYYENNENKYMLYPSTNERSEKDIISWVRGNTNLN